SVYRFGDSRETVLRCKTPLIVSESLHKLSSNRRALVLSVDYEVFGNGTGDSRKHITEPAERMARVCEQFGMPLTIFFEVEEYLAFDRERDHLLVHLGYDPAREIRDQIRELAKRGHDIQLHIHPEWVDCQFANGQWQLRPERSSVDSLFDSVEETTTYIRQRKQVIDDLLASAGSNQRVSAYRAGAFCAQPGRRLLPALEASGIVIESSVEKGMHRRDAVAQLDVSAAPEGRPYWRVREDVPIDNPAGQVIELPIFSRMRRRVHQLTPKRLLAKFSGHVPREKQRELVNRLGIGRTPASIFRFLRQRLPIKLDFHNMTPGELLRWIRSAPTPPPGHLDILVLSGHTKEHRDDGDFMRFLAKVSKDPNLEVISMTEAARRILSQARHGDQRASSNALLPIG